MNRGTDFPASLKSITYEYPMGYILVDEKKNAKILIVMSEAVMISITPPMQCKTHGARLINTQNGMGSGFATQLCPLIDFPKMPFPVA